MKFHEWKSIEQVIYRYVEIALIILGIVLMYSSMNDTFWRGIGLFIQASIVLSLDFCGKTRASLYCIFTRIS
jgi:glucose uptake protein GlcU